MPELDPSKQDKIKKVLERAYQASSLHQMLNFVQPLNWLSLITFMVLIAALVVWSFLGRIPTEVAGKSVALNPKGVFVVRARSSGTIRELFVRPADKVSKDSQIATIYNPQQRSIIDQIKTFQYKVKALSTELETLKRTLVTREELFQEGLISKAILDESKSAVIDKEIAIEESKNTIVKLYSDLEDISSYWKEELQKKESLFAQTSEDLDEIERNLSKVLAPTDGVVLEVLARVGDTLAVKDPLIWMESINQNDTGLTFYSVFSLDQGSKIRIGMPVTIEPARVNPQEYGSMRGIVTQVSPYPVSEADLMNTLANKQLVNFLMGGENATILAQVTPEKDPDTISGYAWTSTEGPPFKIYPGANATVKVVVEEQPPISYLIPLWRIKQPFRDEK